MQRPATPPASATPAERLVRCPCCNGSSVYAARNPWRPFCSERCKKIDLGAWASEDYKLAASSPMDAEKNSI